MAAATDEGDGGGGAEEELANDDVGWMGCLLVFRW